MTGEGTIISISGENATVSVKKTSACPHDCSECSACTMPTYDMQVKNPIGAHPGDRVVIEADTKKILTISLLVYIFPVVLLIVAALLCDIYNAGALLTVGFISLMLVIWFLVIRIANKKLKAQNTVVSVIEPSKG